MPDLRVDQYTEAFDLPAGSFLDLTRWNGIDWDSRKLETENAKALFAFNLATANLLQAAVDRDYDMNGQDLRFDNGKFGVGLALSLLANLHIEGDATGSNKTFLTTDSAGTFTFSILDNGDVYIGDQDDVFSYQMDKSLKKFALLDKQFDATPATYWETIKTNSGGTHYGQGNWYSEDSSTGVMTQLVSIGANGNQQNGRIRILEGGLSAITLARSLSIFELSGILIGSSGPETTAAFEINNETHNASGMSEIAGIAFNAGANDKSWSLRLRLNSGDGKLSLLTAAGEQVRIAAGAENSFIVPGSGRNFGFGTNAPTERWHFKAVGSGTNIQTLWQDSTGATNFIIQDNGVVIFRPFLVASLPAQAAGGMIRISDEVGGDVLAYSDGTNWRRVSDGTIAA